MLQNLGEYFGFEYSPFLQYLHESCLRNYSHWGLDPDAPLLNPFQEDVSEDLIYGKIHEGVYLREIGIVCGIDVGYGVFASAPIRMNELIGEYVGVVMESSTTSSSSYCLNYPAADRSFVINAREIGNLIRFVNHSPTPNSSFQPFMFEGIVHVLCVRSPCICLSSPSVDLSHSLTHLSLSPPSQVSIRDIESEEQITVDYGKGYWSHQEHQPLPLS
jgi:hypothetical protein